MFAYIAGPITPKNGRTLQDNKNEVLSVARVLRTNGVACVSPLLESEDMPTLLTYDEWLWLDIQLIRGAQCVVVCLGAENSHGTREEIKYCNEHDIAVVYAWSDDWIKKCRRYVGIDND